MSNHPAAPRIDWLDGWRAIAVALVIWSHLAGLEQWTVAPPGKLGVFIFFGISGFIVTRLLLGERARTGHIDIAAFFVRRAARILPPLLLYLIVCVAIGQGSAGCALRAALFTCNVAKGPWDCGWTFGHTWSLAFEEQYYLIVPFLLAGRARWLFVPMALALLPFAFPVQFIGRIGAIQIYMLLGFGALVAANEQRMLTWFAKVPPIVAIFLLVLAGFWMGLPPGRVQIVTGLLVPFAILIGVFALPAASSLARTMLASRPLRTIGLYSYTLYLWQQLALAHQPLVPPAIGLALALAFAALSFYTFERGARDLARRALKGLEGRHGDVPQGAAKPS